MRSRMSRGVPEWSEVKIYIWEVIIRSSENFGAYRYCTGATGGVPGVHREGPPLSEGLMGCVGKGTSPRRAGCIPPWAHAPRVGGKP